MAFAPPSPPAIWARFFGGKQPVKAIVIHGTVSSDRPGVARTIAKWWHGITSPKTSAHYLVDPNEVIQCVPDHRIAYHCGFNFGSIAIELCDEETGPASRWRDANSTAILNRAARLVARLCLAYGVAPVRPSIAELKRKGPHGIYGHNDSRLAFGKTTHSDPRDFDWDHFLGLVRKEITALKGDPAPSRVLPSTLRVATVNTNFLEGGDSKLIPHVAQDADILAVQEARHAGKPYRAVRLLPWLGKGWASNQDVSDGPHAESALAWRTGIRAAHRTLDFGAGSRSVAGKVAAMTDRYISAEDFQTKNGWITVIACHYPPLRFAFLWPVYDRALAKVLAAHTHPRLILTDGNAPLDKIAKRKALAKFNLRTFGEGIIGGLATPGVKFSNVRIDHDAERWTDHAAVHATIWRNAA